MKRAILILLVLVAVGVGAGAYYIRKGGPEPVVMTAPISRGDIVDTVGATGTLEAVTTVQVGTQVSGTLQDLYADFNSIVHKGQVIARLDPSLIQTQIEQQRANVIRAEADLERLKVALADAEQKLKRAQDLAARNLIPRTELETAEVNVRSAEAQLKSAEASLRQARAALNNQQVNLAHTVIEAPIDGIVISRNVDVGQTVAASMSAPTLFVIAADLTKMQVNANIDEADVGRMRPDQVVRFRVDAYPTEEFIGTVHQVRLEPKTVQNVVTYQTVISVPNPELKLKPGMTANVNIEIARKNNVLRVPNAALRFRPTNETFAALNQPVPPEMQRGAGGRGQFGARTGAPGQGGQGAGVQQGRSSSGNQTSPEARGGGDPAGVSGDRGGLGGGGGGVDPNMTPEERQRRLQERLAQMTPEEREAFQARMRERQAQGGFAGTGANRTARTTQPSRLASAPSMTTGGATTIDSLFGPLPTVESRGRVWLFMNKQLKPVTLRLGISDGTYTEILDGEGLDAGTEVVTNVVTNTESRTQSGQQGGTNNPLMGPQRGRGGPGGFGGPAGGGNRGGR
jgi:HlyD family secretion protein